MSKGKEILGEKSYPDLASIPDIVEVVGIFRKSEDVLPIVQDAIDIGAKVAWLQEGVVNEEAADYARKARLEVEHFELGSFNLKEALIDTSKGMRACQDYGKTFGQKPS